MKITTKTLFALCGSLALTAAAQAQLTYTTGLDVWLDASDLDGSDNSTLTDGQAITTWTNKGTTGVNDGTVVGGGGTTFSLTGGNGAQDALTLNNTRHQFGQEFMDSSSFTIYFVVNQSALSSAAGTLLTDYGNSGNELFTIRAGNSVSGTRDAAGEATWVNDGNVQADQVWTTLFFSLDASTGTATYGELGNLNTTVNALYDPTTVFDGTHGGPSTLFSFHDGNAGHDFNGLVSEVLIYDHLLAPGDQATVEAYLLDKSLVPDVDMDGISDEYELANTVPPSDTALVPALDDDADGLTNLQEYLGLDAADADHGFGQTLAIAADSDGDGIDDNDELTGADNPYQVGHFPGDAPGGTPGEATNPNDDDSDDDEILDGEEVNAGVDTFITNPNETDTDGDFMGDFYEISNNLLGGLDPTDFNDAFSDLDSDTIANIDEHDAAPQTRADKADTDDDGYGDEVEDNNPAGWGSVTATGTDPTNPDSDGDGLLDGEENPDLGAHNPPTQYISDPNVYDSDIDGYGDGDEVAASSDPAVNASFPPAAAGTAVQIDFHRSDNATGQEIQAGWAVWEFDSQVKPTSFNGTIGGIGITMTAGGAGGYLSSRGGPEVSRGGEITGTSWDDVVEDLLIARNGDGTLTIDLTDLGAETTYTLTILHNDPYTVANNVGFGDGGVITPSITTGTIVGTAQSGTNSNVRPGARTDDDFSESVVSFTTDISGNATILLTGTTQFVVLNGLDLAIGLPAGDPAGLQITKATFNGGGFDITVSGLDTAKSYVLTRSADLQDGFPTTAFGPFTPATSMETVTDATPLAGQPYYRIEEAP